MDIRKDVVDKANAVASSLGYSPNLRFLQGGIADLVLEHAQRQGREDEEEAAASSSSSSYDIVVALHACDTATDDALHLGVGAGARVILSSPCCHKEVRREMTRSMAAAAANDAADSSSRRGSHGLGTQQAPLVRHGILLERQAELVTDALRVLCLEAAGYRSQVMEFINDEATRYVVRDCVGARIV